METYSEVQQQDLQRRQRAMRFEQLRNSRTTLRAAVERLEAQADATSTAALEEMAALVGKVPAAAKTDACGSLGFTIAGGMTARPVLSMVINSTLSFMRRRDEERRQQLEDAKKNLARVEQELMEFEG